MSSFFGAARGLVTSKRSIILHANRRKSSHTYWPSAFVWDSHSVVTEIARDGQIEGRNVLPAEFEGIHIKRGDINALLATHSDDR